MYPQISMRTMTLSTSALPARTGPAGSSRPSSSCWPASRASPSSSSSPCSSASSSARSRSILSWPVYILSSGWGRHRVSEGGGGGGQHRHHLHLAPLGAGVGGDLTPSLGGHRGGAGQHGQAGYIEQRALELTLTRLYRRCRTGVCACLRLHPLQLPAPHLCRQTD